MLKIHRGRKGREAQSRIAKGVRRCEVFKLVHVEFLGRNRAFQVMEMDNDLPNLVGRIPLAYLDFVVDPRSQKPIPNPEHGDKQMSEEY